MRTSVRVHRGNLFGSLDGTWPSGSNLVNCVPSRCTALDQVARQQRTSPAQPTLAVDSDSPAARQLIHDGLDTDLELLG